MADNSYTSVTNQSWFSRIGDAFKGMLVGLLMFLGSFVMLIWNEHRAIDTTRGLEQAQKEVLTVASSPVKPENNGKLVYFVADATATDPVIDTIFGVSHPALVLSRKVEMYQWSESEQTSEEKKLGGDTETTTTYAYQKEWSASLINSSGFAHPEGHGNPSEMPYSRQKLYAQVKAGDFTLPVGLLDQLPLDTSVSPDSNAAPPEGFVVSGNGFYRGTPKSPEVGDVRVSFSAAMPGPVSVVAQQIDDTLEPFYTDTGTTVAILEVGKMGVNNLFNIAHKENANTTWIFRAGGFILMAIGLMLLLKPLSIFADVLPILGSIVGVGTSIVAVLTALVLSLITIAITWISVRPFMAVGLLVLAGGAAYLLMKRKKAADLKIATKSSAVATDD